jgi:L-threonylcarbamoyladenylate synthase
VTVAAVELAAAVAILRRGGVVCLPTETFYGLAVDAVDEAAIARLVALKGREEGKPIAVIAPDLDGARRLWAEAPARLLELAAAHWPGPLTLVARARAGVPAALVGPGGGVGARVSSHPVAAALARGLGRPITATSANLAGEPPAHSVAEARARLGAGVDLYLDDGPAPGGPASTVAEVTADGRVLVHRPGAVAL